MKDMINNWKTVLLMCAMLGLAPFLPEPHIWGKIKWVMGGAKDMALMDWLDLLMHGTPWLLLGRILVLKGISLAKSKD